MNSSKKKTLALGVLALSAAVALLNLAGTNTSRSIAGIETAKPASPNGAQIAQVRDAYGQLPLAFELNRGQADETTNFQARGAGYTLSLAATEASFLLARGSDEPSSTVLRMNIVGANPGAAVEGLNELEGRVNYLIGNDPTQWRTDIPTFSRVRYSEVYRGIDVVYYGNQRRLEYDFVVAPGSDAGLIALEFAGAEKMEVEAVTGDLLLGIAKKTIRQHKPVVYQETSAGRRDIESRYAIRSDGRVGFEVGGYDASAPLVIDPVLEYSTYLGGDSGEEGCSIAVDSAGNAYVAGFTQSANFPGADPNDGDLDIFVTKINAAGTALIYSTYFGGSDGESGPGLAIDSAGNAYLTGNTSSTDFPTVNPIQGASGGNQDAFVTKLNAAGTALVYSTYLGGSSGDNGDNIAVDSAGNAYIIGNTGSTNFPTVNAIDGTLGGEADAFVTKINAAGTALVYSTYLGGSAGDAGLGFAFEFGLGIAVDSAGNAYVVGHTDCTDFPTVNAIQSTKGSELSDAFVTKINPAGTALVYSTYLGGAGEDEGNAIALDAAGNAYVTGSTNSTNFPLANAFQSTYGGDGNFGFGDVFVTKINSAGTALVYSTYLGGAGTEYARAIAVSSTGEAYITGTVTSTNFPTANPIQATHNGGTEFFFDAFVTKFNATGTALIYSTYLGGGSRDDGEDIALDSAGNAYVIGDTRSTCFPTTVGAFDTTFNGGDNDCFVLKISETAPPSQVNSCPSQLLNLGTRLRVLTGDSALIGGFIITGDDPKRVIIRGIGPSTNLPGALANPTLELFASNQRLLGSNDNWTSNAAEVQATGIPPSHNLESAIVARLPPGAYTAVLRGHSNSTGIGLIEVYDLNPAEHSLLANLSSRGFVDTGDNAIIGGFIVGGGSAPTRVLVRGIGPSLAFPNALVNPTLELRNANGSLIRSNDDWRDSQETEIQGTGIPPTNNLEAAIIASVGNGSYTAILRGKDNTTGMAVVEIYNVP